MKKYELSIDGMSCAACAARIEKVLNRHAKVRSAIVNYASENASISTDLSRSDISQLIETIGYSVREEGQVSDNHDSWLLVSLILLSFPVFVLGMGWVDLGELGIVLQWVLTSLVLLVGGRGFYRRAFALAKSLDTNMDSLVVVGTLSAYIFSIYSYIWLKGDVYFESASMIITFVFLGKFIEKKAKRNTLAAVEALSQLKPQYANIFQTFTSLDDLSSISQIPLKELKVGDIVLVKVGESIPSDGVLIEDNSEVDNSMITGESELVAVKPGDTLIGGTINLGSPLAMRISQVGKGTVLSQIIELVKNAQNRKPPVQKIADRIASVFVPGVFLFSIITLVSWWVLTGTWQQSIIPAVTVLVISCPCALGLATPIALVAASGRAARDGILVKDLEALELIEKAKFLVFDKTGTLTYGHPNVVYHEISPDCFDLTETQILAICKGMESHSNHPMAKALVDYIKDEHDGPLVQSVQEKAGLGLKADIILGGKKWEMLLGRGQKEHLRGADQDLLERASIVSLSHQGDVLASFAITDKLRDNAKETVDRLRALGIELSIASGDRREVVSTIARNFVPTISFKGELTPENKASYVKELKTKGPVIMVGDGINDAPALTEATVGIALGSGTDVAIKSAMITLKSGSIHKIADLIKLSKKTIAIIKENLLWAFLYNIILIPFAALGYLSPMLASGAMVLSSLSVVFNSLRLNRGKLI